MLLMILSEYNLARSVCTAFGLASVGFPTELDVSIIATIMASFFWHTYQLHTVIVTSEAATDYLVR